MAQFGFEPAEHNLFPDSRAEVRLSGSVALRTGFCLPGNVAKNIRKLQQQRRLCRSKPRTETSASRRKFLSGITAEVNQGTGLLD